MTYPATQVIELSIDILKPYPRNSRTHSRKQIRQIASSIERFGFTNPVLISDDGEIIAGHGRVEAAKLNPVSSTSKSRSTNACNSIARISLSHPALSASLLSAST